LQQGSKSCTEYIRLAKQWADQLAAAGKPVDEDDLISYIISGLNPTFNSFVTAFSLAIRTTEMSFADFQTELLSHEKLLDNQQQNTPASETNSFAFYTNKRSFHLSSIQQEAKIPTKNPSRFSTPSPRYSTSTTRFSIQPTRPHTPSRNTTSTVTPRASFNNTHSVACQICGKFNHTALDCYHRMDYAYQGRLPSPQLQAMVAHHHAEIDSHEWLADSGANTHVATDPTTINNPQPFGGTETVGVGNGTGLDISSIGSSVVQSNSSQPSQFLLKDILYCPSASANLLSINKFCRDNHCSFELTGSHYTVKDNLTGIMLLQGLSENGLYPISLHRLQSSLQSNKLKGFAAFVGVKTSDMVWHQRLGHPSNAVFHRVMSIQQLHVCGSLKTLNVCESCQLGKSKQQPFSSSSRCTKSPLELIHSNVWTSPVSSMSGCHFYVIFVDDYSRYSWLYPIINKSDFFNALSSLNC